MIHRHVWKISQRDEQPSDIEAAHALGVEISMERTIPEHIHKLLVRPLIVTYFCAKCGTQKVVRV